MSKIQHIALYIPSTETRPSYTSKALATLRTILNTEIVYNGSYEVFHSKNGWGFYLYGHRFIVHPLATTSSESFYSILHHKYQDWHPGRSYKLVETYYKNLLKSSYYDAVSKFILVIEDEDEFLDAKGLYDLGCLLLRYTGGITGESWSDNKFMLNLNLSKTDMIAKSLEIEKDIIDFELELLTH